MDSMTPRDRVHPVHLTKPEQIPEFRDVLTAVGAEVALRDEDRRVVAALLVGEREVELVHRTFRDDADVVTMCRRKVEARGYTVVATHPADEAIVSMCYVRRDSQTRQAQSRGDSKAEAWCDELFANALTQGASDIHIHVFGEHAEIKFRINGDIRRIATISRDEAMTYSNAMFVMADADSKRGKPAFDPNAFIDASITRELTVMREGKPSRAKVKLRWASSPAYPNAWNIVFRVLPIGVSGRSLSLQRLGYSPAQIELFEYALKAPTGLILMCGETGSGKTTTLASLIESWFFRYEGRKTMLTIEDPPEVLLAGGQVRQVPVSRTGDEAPGQVTGFIKALKSAMRQDPDGLMIGEMRDSETARIGQAAVQTGHKMFSTVHTKGAMEAVPRLVDLGMERSELCSPGFINAIIYQKLLPVLCHHCKVELKHHRDTVERGLLANLEELFTPAEVDSLYLRGPGCANCKNGIKERTVVAEMLVPDVEVLELLSEGRYNLARAYWQGGLCKRRGGDQGQNVLDHALSKMLQGMCSPVDVEASLGALDERIDHKAQAEFYRNHVNKRSG